MDSHRASLPQMINEERLYLKANTTRRLSLGFNGLAADWYWMRSLQYVGKKILSVPQDVVIDDLSQLKLTLLAPLLDTATTLDPQFLEPYEYAAIVLPSIDVQEAIRITNKGIAANPKAWRLYQHLGYIYWQQHEYRKASEAYLAGAKIEGAPSWMEAMSAKMAAEGGSRDVAREIYRRMFDQASDEKVKDMARRRLLQVDSLDQRDALRQLAAAFRDRYGRCPSAWRDLEPALRALRWNVDRTGAPLDPTGAPYILLKDRCDVELHPQSEIPGK
jgi:tetratricopeptide (TPR) repeat protein